MDVVLKGLSLVFTQVHATCSLLLALPGVALYLLQGATPVASDAGAVFYEGRVKHARRKPVAHSFEYPVRMALIDLDAPPAWFSGSLARDHLTASEARAFAGTDGPVQLLTHPPAAGYTQNPISVYYCHPSGGGPAERAIAEVTNTPWAERVSFVFRPSGETVAKALHVSPLMDMEGSWRLQGTQPGKHLGLSVLVHHPTLGQFFDAHLMLRRCSGEWSALRNERAGWGTLLRYGFLPQRVALWIYWQAVVLGAKGCPFHNKPAFGGYPAAATRCSPTHPPAASSGQAFVWRPTVWPWNLD